MEYILFIKQKSDINVKLSDMIHVTNSMTSDRCIFVSLGSVQRSILIQLSRRLFDNSNGRGSGP